MTRRDFALAAKAIIFRDDTMLLLHRSKDEIAQSSFNKVDEWDLPGGGVQFFEKIEAGLYREVLEETSLNVNILKPIDVHDFIRPHLHITIVTYLCRYESGEVLLSKEHDFSKWMTIDELRGFAIPKWLLKNYEKSLVEYGKL